MLLRGGAAAVCGALLLSLAACGNSDAPVSDTTPTTAATTAPTTVPETLYDNLLTGEKSLKTQNNRPVAFMIDNYSASVRQKNIDKADLYVEAETEAGIPRIMAVFGSIDSVPAQVGPCRSARTPFVKMAKALDTIYCHVGGSTLGKAMIKEKRVTDLDSLVEVSRELKAVNGAIEHTKVFSRAKMDDAIKKRGISVKTATPVPYAFGEKAGDGAGNAVQVNISSRWKVSFTYDAATKQYTKHRNVLSSPEHVSYDGDPIRVSNVIIMYDTRFDEDSAHISFQLNAGNGTLVSGGTSRAVKWKRTDSGLSFTEADGTPLTVATGKTYICLTSATLANQTVLQ